MTPKSVGFKVGLMAASLHFLLAVLAYVAMSGSKSSTAGLVFLPFFVLDAPLWFLQTLLPDAAGKFIMGNPLFSFGILGSAMWFVLPWLVDRLVGRFFPKVRRLARWIVVLASLPLVLLAFLPLSSQTSMMSMRNSRPEELKAMLAKPAPGILAKRTVLEDQHLRGICGIHRADGSGELLVAFHRGVLRLDSQYAEKSRLEFSTNHFQAVVPLRTGGAFSGQFLVYKFFQYAAVLDSDGQELWRAGEKADEGQPIAGTMFGDIDGDGQPEFAIYRNYREGIELLDEAGRSLWRHPVYSLGHVEMADVSGNGKKEILYSNSNNARSSTVFKTVNADGKVVDELKLTTTSSEFALIDWPERRNRPNLLLTEENQIRIVDMDGNEIRQLNAPGCRSYGDVAAIPVKFRADAPAYLAVRKNLHPDLAALFIYDAEGKLVQQDVETRRGGSGSPALAAVPGEMPDTERLLVGSENGFQSQILEYLLD